MGLGGSCSPEGIFSSDYSSFLLPLDGGILEFGYFTPTGSWRYVVSGNVSCCINTDISAGLMPGTRGAFLPATA